MHRLAISIQLAYNIVAFKTMKHLKQLVLDMRKYQRVDVVFCPDVLHVWK
jgi:hypothetical protein